MSAALAAHVVRPASLSLSAGKEPEDLARHVEGKRIISQLMEADQVQAAKCVVLKTLEVLPGAEPYRRARYLVRELSGRQLRVRQESKKGLKTCVLVLVFGFS